MPAIQVDGDVIAALQQHGKFGESFNDVMRRVLGMPRRARRYGRRGARTLADLVAAGLLHPGQTVTWHRRNLNVTHHVTVTKAGALATQDGQTYTSPATCASRLAGHPSQGWDYFRTEDGTTLRELREQPVQDTSTVEPDGPSGDKP